MFARALLRPVLAILLLLIASPAAQSSLIVTPVAVTIDAFTDGIAPPGVTVDSLGTGATPFTEVGLSGVLGHTRTTTLTLETAGRNGDVKLKMTGAGLQYISRNGNNVADGSFNLFYNGSSGFPADFSSATEIVLDVHSQNNPGAATTFVVTLTDGTNTFASAVQSLIGHSNGDTITFPFAGFSNNLVTSGALGAITSVNLLVNPAPGTNITLADLTLGGSAGPGDSGGPGGPGNPVPEPATLAIFGAMTGFGALAYRLRRKTPVAA